MNVKTKLLETIAGRNRGALATEGERVRILSLIERLEDGNPTPKPCQERQLLAGDWRLLFTTSRGILGLDRVPFIQLGQVYQCIRPDEGKVYNIAELVGVPFLEGIVSVVASFEAVSEHRVNVRFERSILGLQRLLDYRSPAAFIESIDNKKFPFLDFNIERPDRPAWLDITYLDNDLRVGRGNEGSVFVLSRESSGG